MLLAAIQVLAASLFVVAVVFLDMALHVVLQVQRPAITDQVRKFRIRLGQAVIYEKYVCAYDDWPPFFPFIITRWVIRRSILGWCFLRTERRPRRMRCGKPNFKMIEMVTGKHAGVC